MEAPCSTGVAGSCKNQTVAAKIKKLSNFKSLGTVKMYKNVLTDFKP